MKIDPNSFIGNMPKDKLGAYRFCIFVLSLCAPLRATEILSIIYEHEIFQTLPDGKKLYGWRYISEYSSTEEIIWIPESLAPVAQEAICRLRALDLENPLYKLIIMGKFRMSSNQFRKARADVYMRNLCANIIEGNQIPPKTDQPKSA